MAAGLTLRFLVSSELRSIARIHCAAFEESALSRLGLNTVERYYRWQLFGPHQSVGVGAERNGNLVGFCIAGIFHGSMSGFLRENWTFLIRQVVFRPWLLAQPLFRTRTKKAVRLLQRFLRPGQQTGRRSIKAAERCFGVLAIAVSPSEQGKGVGKALMGRCEIAARQMGARTMILTVHPDNVHAVHFYEGIGWEKVPGKNGWGGSMIKRLDP